MTDPTVARTSWLAGSIVPVTGDAVTESLGVGVAVFVELGAVVVGAGLVGSVAEGVGVPESMGVPLTEGSGTASVGPVLTRAAGSVGEGSTAETDAGLESRVAATATGAPTATARRVAVAIADIAETQGDR